MTEIVEFGTDFKTDYNFVNGDLELVSDKENLIQSITNRINTDEGLFDLFYEDYGGNVRSFMGWQSVPETLDYLEIELTTILQQDPRLIDFDITLNYIGNGKVKINLRIYYDEDSDLSLSLVLSNMGVEVETDENEEE